MDRLTKEEWRKKSTGSQIYAFTYNYDAAGNRHKMRREAVAGVETESAYYAFDVANALVKRWVEPGQVMTYFAYDPNGSFRSIHASTAHRKASDRVSC